MATARRHFEGDHQGVGVSQQIGIPHARIDHRAATRRDDDLGTSERAFEQFPLDRPKRRLAVLAKDVGDWLTEPPGDTVIGVGHAPSQARAERSRHRRFTRAAEPDEYDSLRHRRTSFAVTLTG